jgi:5-methyltetrahydropteroyltriglutamate--homocysteine methyltransferase
MCGRAESHWAGRTGEAELRETAAGLRVGAWRRARSAGIDVVPSGDQSLYDHVLDAAWELGAIPERFGGPGAEGLDAYFAMARGSADAHPLEMTKWLDTNYHYLVPELAEGQAFRARHGHWTEQIAHARGLGIATRPVILGPFSFLRLSKGLARPLDALDALVRTTSSRPNMVPGVGPSPDKMLRRPVSGMRFCEWMKSWERIARGPGSA